MKISRSWWLAVAVLTISLQLLPTARQARAQDQQQGTQEQNSQDQVNQEPAEPNPQDQNAPEQTAQEQPEDQDPPTRVARLNYSSGTVSFQPGGEGEWVTAVANRPLTTGDNLWADKNSRAELHVGSLAMRMNSETSLTFLDLDDRTTQLRLSLGSLILRVRHLDDGDLLEVDTPNIAFNIQGTGEYRVDVIRMAPRPSRPSGTDAERLPAEATHTRWLPVNKPLFLEPINSIMRSRRSIPPTTLTNLRLIATPAKTTTNHRTISLPR